MSDDELVERVRELIYDADPEIPAAAVVALCREAIAAEIEAHVEEAKQRAWDADYEATSTARDTVAFCAELVRRGEQQ